MSNLSMCLLFDGRAAEAAGYYVSVFHDCGRPASILSDVASTMAVQFELDGQPMLALNAGPNFTFSPAISLMVSCADQAEVDAFWTKLCDGGAPSRCGWLSDRFGVSWQIVPKALGEMMKDPDGARRDKVMRALMTMGKLDVEGLRRAYEG